MLPLHRTMNPSQDLLDDLDFRRQALMEAARYGSDPWVFVRELLQNARDAGATTVNLVGEVEDGVARVICQDDGSGMDFEHARRYFFALYASSKEGQATEVGQFGIGFWSVLRFRPWTLRVTSRTEHGKAWQVELDGDLEQARVVEDAGPVPTGTRIELERSAGDGDPAVRLLWAARRYARYLRQRNGGDLTVRVNGQVINEPLALPEPSAAFSGRNFRGVVGLGDAPRVELFGHGLFVRSASSLGELLDGERPEEEEAEEALADLPRLAPQVLFDSDGLELLLARSDARQNRQLERLVRRAESELVALVKRRLQALSPQPWYRIWAGILGERLERLVEQLRQTPRRALALTLVLGTLLGLLVFSLLGDRILQVTEPVAQEIVDTVGRPPDIEFLDVLPSQPLGDMEVPLLEGGEGRAAGSGGGLPVAGARSPVSEGGLRPYRDLSQRYTGPWIDPLSEEHESDRAILSYEPSEQNLLLNALVVEGFARSDFLGLDSESRRSYRTRPCLRDCVKISMVAEVDAAEWLRLPVPTGHRLDATSLRVGLSRSAVWEGRFGEPQLLLEGPGKVLVEYRTGPAEAPSSPPFALPELPEELVRQAEELRLLEPGERAQAAADWVSQRVVYSRSREAVSTFTAATAQGLPFLESALLSGVGDCDVQNGVLATLLEASGLEARMVLGFVGRGGVASPGLHAWVEVRGEDGRFQPVDASLGGDGGVHPLTTLGTGLGASVPQVVSLPEGDDGLSPWLLAFLALLALSAAGFAWQRRTQPEAAGGEDLAALLAGALRHPGAFAAMPALEHGRYIPKLGRGALSLHQIRGLAAHRQLFHSQGGWLSRKAVQRGLPVIDGSKPEGAVVLRALSAVDLDHWQRLLDGAQQTDKSEWVNQRLKELGVSWGIRESPAQAAAIEEVDLSRLKLGPRWVMVGPSHPDLKAIWERLGDGEALFDLLERVVPQLDIPETEGAELLSRVAEAALVERMGRLVKEGA